MAQFYKILKADPLGEPWTPSQEGAKPIQNYWCQVEGEELAVSIGKQVGNSLNPGEHVYGDLMKAQSQKGTNYWKFKSSKVPEGVTRPANSPAQATAQAATGQQPVDMSATQPDWFRPWGNMIEFIYKEMKAMSTSDEPDVVTTPAPEPAKGVEVLAGEVSEETQATLNDIFGDEPEPEV